MTDPAALVDEASTDIDVEETPDDILAAQALETLAITKLPERQADVVETVNATLDKHEITSARFSRTTAVTNFTMAQTLRVFALGQLLDPRTGRLWKPSKFFGKPGETRVRNAMAAVNSARALLKDAHEQMAYAQTRMTADPAGAAGARPPVPEAPKTERESRIDKALGRT
jgi:hypothetical protein